MKSNRNGFSIASVMISVVIAAVVLMVSAKLIRDTSQKQFRGNTQVILDSFHDLALQALRKPQVTREYLASHPTWQTPWSNAGVDGNLKLCFRGQGVNCQSSYDLGEGPMKYTAADASDVQPSLLRDLLSKFSLRVQAFAAAVRTVISSAM